MLIDFSNLASGQSFIEARFRNSELQSNWIKLDKKATTFIFGFLFFEKMLRMTSFSINECILVFLNSFLTFEQSFLFNFFLKLGFTIFDFK